MANAAIVEYQRNYQSTNDNVPSTQTAASLPALVRRASTALASAESAAEILDAKVAATFAYDAAKVAGRFARAKGAHDEVIGAVYRAQADALEIEATAKRRLADEYDAAQERGEVATRADQNLLPEQKKVSVTDLGLTHKDIHEARLVRDAEAADPGVVRRTLDALIESGAEPTKAAINREIVNRTNFTGNNEWYTPPEYIEIARSLMGQFDLDPASNDFAQKTIKASTYYTEETNGLDKPWHGKVWLNPPYSQPAIGLFADKIASEWEAGNISEAVVLTHNYTDTVWFRRVNRAASATCFTHGRIKFVGPKGEVAAPTQGQAFFYFGNNVDGFSEAFSNVGTVMQVKQ